MVNGKTTFLNEIEVTEISLAIKQNPHLVQSYEVKTNLEKKLIIKQAIDFLQEEITELKQENLQLKSNITILKPKAIEYDTFISNKSSQKIGDVAKIFGIKPNTLHQMLRDAKIMQENYTPYAQYQHLFKTVETPTPAGFNRFTSYFLPEGITYIAKKFKLIETIDNQIAQIN
jgi:phage antirepressor YoqD-like protein